MAETKNSIGQWMLAIIVSVIAQVIYFWFLSVIGDERIEPVNENSTEADVSGQVNVQTNDVRATGETREVVETRDVERTTSENISSHAERRPRPALPQSRPTPAREDGETEIMPSVYVVKPGDTLTKIAKKYNTTPEQLARINGKPIKKMNLLWVGQKIKLK